MEKGFKVFKFFKNFFHLDSYCPDKTKTPSVIFLPQTAPPLLLLYIFYFVTLTLEDKPLLLNNF